MKLEMLQVLTAAILALVVCAQYYAEARRRLSKQRAVLG
jgi:hypothetical protein